jgi:CRP-like cAMP-binding protein
VEALQKAIKNISPLSPAVAKKFLEAWQEWTVPKDHLLAREHAVSDYIFFVEKGAVRIYYHKNDKEITEWIALDENFFLSITSFFERKPGHLIIQTLEPSVVAGIHYTDLMALADKYHEIEKLLRKMVTRSLIMSQERMKSIQFETAQQRYEKLITATPEIIKRVPLSHIASFLGITAETLSRIRAGK